MQYYNYHPMRETTMRFFYLYRNIRMLHKERDYVFNLIINIVVVF